MRQSFWGAHAPSRVGFGAVAETKQGDRPGRLVMSMQPAEEVRTGEGANASTRGRARSPEAERLLVKDLNIRRWNEQADASILVKL